MQPPREQERYWAYILRRTRECNDAEKAREMDRREVRGSLRSDNLDEKTGWNERNDNVSVEEASEDKSDSS